MSRKNSLPPRRKTDPTARDIIEEWEVKSTEALALWALVRDDVGNDDDIPYQIEAAFELLACLGGLRRIDHQRHPAAAVWHDRIQTVVGAAQGDILSLLREVTPLCGWLEDAQAWEDADPGDFDITPQRRRKAMALWDDLDDTALVVSVLDAIDLDLAMEMDKALAPCVRWMSQRWASFVGIGPYCRACLESFAPEITAAPTDEISVEMSALLPTALPASYVLDAWARDWSEANAPIPAFDLDKAKLRALAAQVPSQITK